MVDHENLFVLKNFQPCGAERLALRYLHFLGTLTGGFLLLIL